MPTAATSDGRPIVRVLGIETSCDETAAAVVEHGTTIVSSVVSSQIDLHARYGGVVPELAGRAHVELLTPVLADALAQAGSDPSGRGIDGIAVTHGPGLIGSLLVGVAEAKALSMAWGVPLVGVNHLEAHLFASLLEQPDLGWPLVVLLVSGGHTLLIEVTAPGEYRLLGGTIDDAAGEAFDKVARFIGLGYPGGPAIDRHLPDGRPRRLRLPPVAARRRLRLQLQRPQDLGGEPGPQGARRRRPPTWPPRSRRRWSTSWSPGPVGRPPTWGPGPCAWPAGWRPTRCCGPGSRQACAEDGIGAFLPSRALCTDNAAMVAAAGHWRLHPGGPQRPRPGRRPQPPPRLDALRRRPATAGRTLALGGAVANAVRAGYR